MMSDERLVSPESIESPQSSESIENADPALRPRRLNEFVGHGLGRRNLETFIAASVQRGDALITHYCMDLLACKTPCTDNFC